MTEIKNYYKKELNVNGSTRTVLVSKDDLLVDVIRKQLGLTGTKVGCRQNQCGVCSVILDGKLVKSCMIKMSRVAENAKITTIEGIGTPDNLHPLQAAWVKYGAAQCGFCTPGFIVAAKVLLDENPNPTRKEVRAWFSKNKNACRCTGYKPIVDSVMAAAKVMRGEMSVEELGFKMPVDGRIFGTDYPRPSAIAKVTGTFDFGADTGLKLPEGTLRIALVQAKVSHANILSIDTEEAKKMPGVAAVLTHKDVQGTNRINNMLFYSWSKGSGFDRPILCDEKIFQYGDVVALVCADTQEHADAAAEKVVLELEELPAYMNALEAAAPDAMEIHPGSPNVFCEQPTIKGEDPVPLLEKADVVIKADYYTQRQPHLVLEPDVGYAYYDENGLLTIHSKSVHIYLHRDMICEGLGLDKEQIRLIQNNTGGTFGYKLSPTIEGYLGVACMATGKPVYLEFNMQQQLTYTGKRSPFFMHLEMGANKSDGKIVGLNANFLIDHGAYSELGDLLLTRGNQFMGAGYHIENLRNLGRITITNHAYGAAMRGYGSPQSLFATESIIDELAKALGEDPFEFRYKNLYKPESTTPYGNKHDELVYGTLMDMLRPTYEAAKKRAAEGSTDTLKRGVGIALACYCVGDETCDASDAAMALLPDGKFAMYNTWEDHGQGADIGCITLTQESLHKCGIDVSPDQIVLVSNDTSKCPCSGAAAGSRSQVITGNAIFDACEKLTNAMKKSNGSFRTYDEMVAEGIETYYLGSFSTGDFCTALDHKSGLTPYSHIAFMYGVFIAEVVVDITTGKTKLVKMTVAVDSGKIGNKAAVDGQYYGGIELGVGMALSEDFEDLKRHNTLARSGFPYIEDLPDEIDILYLETPRKHSAFGSSGCGEVVTSSPHAAIINAIDNACGARIRNLPAYPEKVLAALQTKKA